MKCAIRSLLVAMFMLLLAGCGAKTTPVDAQYRNAGKYRFGQSRADLAGIEEQIRNAKPEQYRGIETRLLSVVKSSDTTIDAKRYLVRYLGIVGSSKSVPTLAAMLPDPQLSHSARIALEPMQNQAAGDALRKALTQVKGNLQAGVISSIGARRDAKAVGALAALAAGSDPAVASAAVGALGAIGTSESARALQDFAPKAPEPLRRPIAQALVDCADRLAHSGQKTEAAGIYRRVLDTNARAQQIAAVKGLIAVSDRAEAVPLTISMLQSNDAALRAAAVAALRECTDKAVQIAVIQKLPTFDPPAQLAVLAILNDLKDVPARDSIMAVLKDGSEPVRAAAIECLAVHAAVTDVPKLVNLATSASTQAEKDAARSALERMGKPGTSEALLRLMEGADPAGRRVVLAALASRQVTAALSAISKLLAGSDAQLAADAARALGSMGSAQELAVLIGILAKASDEGLRTACEDAAGAICTRISDPQACGPVVLAALTNAGGSTRISLIKLLPRVRGDDALAAACKALADAECRATALRALADWPDLSAAAPLIQFAQSTDDERLAILAVQGCLRMAARRNQPQPQRLATYRSILDSARRVEEKRQAIAGLGDLNTAGALNLLARCAEDKALADDAARAALRLVGQRNSPARGKAAPALEKIKAQPISDDLKAKIDQAIQTERPGRSR